jgi:hypothetical protein
MAEDEQKPAGEVTKNGKAPAERHDVGEQLHKLAQMRHDPDAIRHAFETGEYPYKSKSSALTMKSTRPSFRSNC